MKYKLISLFDGSGGFPLAGMLCGIEPVVASEVEPYPIAVTTSRFPKMKHLGSVTDVKGNEIEPADVLCFGAPCQDLSVAGLRKGIRHGSLGDEETTRSGLFMEAVRIIKEMRAASNGVYPRFAIYENVPGAFSSSKGEDFRIVLEELIKIVEPNAVMPPVPKGGWPYADCYCCEGWSLSYRTFDAQYWGVPQRRRRIYLVADFRGECAGKVLFEREGLRGHSETCRTPWQGITRNVADCFGAADSKAICVGFDMYNQQCTGEVSRTIKTPAGGDDIPVVCYDARGNGDGCVVSTLTGDHENRITDYTSVVCEPVYGIQGNSIERSDTAGCNGNGVREDICYKLNTIDRPAVEYLSSGIEENKHQNIAYSMKSIARNGIPLVEQANPICASDYKDPDIVAYPPDGIRYIVRRLTPTECARLQGFPDFWSSPDHKDSFTDEEYQFWLNVRNTHAEINGKAVKEYTKDQMLKWFNGLHTDSSEYKMWGNGIALPCALYVMQGIVGALEDGTT